MATTVKSTLTGGEAAEVKKEIPESALLDKAAQADPVELDVVKTDMVGMSGLLDDLKWLNEKRPITILSAMDEADATNIVEIRVNNKLFVFRRDEEKAVPRYVIEHIARAKRDRHSFDAAVVNNQVKTTNHTQRLFKYMHVFAPQGAREQQWYNAAKQAHF
jgi:hypothetical protein